MWYGADQNGAEQKNINDPDTNPRDFQQDYPAEFNLHTKLYHLNLQYDFDWFSIKSVSGYQSINHQQQEDSSRGAVSYLDYYDDVAGWNTKMKNFNEEFDLVSKPGTPVDWVVGALAINQSSHQFVAEFECNPSPYTPPCTEPTPAQIAIPSNIETNPPANLNYGNDSSVTRHSYAAFAQASYHITPDLTFTAGGRYNADNYSQRSINFSNNGVNTQRVQASDRVPTFKADLDYNVTADNLVYASVSRGYKPGGTNGIDNSEYGALQVPVQNTFEAETNTAFEIGSKNFFMDHALRVNLAAYYYFYRNMQFIGDNPEEFNSGMTNIPSIHAYGVEAETSYVALEDRLRVNGSIALENSEVEGNYYAINSTTLGALINNPPLTSPCAFDGTFYNPGCWKLALDSEENLKGKTAPAMPKISGAADISYTFDVPYGTLTPRAQFVFRGAEWERVFNEPAIDRINSYGLINLNLLYVPTASRWTVQLAATNVTNVNGINSKYTDPYGSFQTSVEYIPPLQVIGTVAYHW
jgi:iron complex outermembrane receptor protein